MSEEQERAAAKEAKASSKAHVGIAEKWGTEAGTDGRRRARVRTVGGDNNKGYKGNYKGDPMKVTGKGINAIDYYNYDGYADQASSQWNSPQNWAWSAPPFAPRPQPQPHSQAPAARSPSPSS